MTTTVVSANGTLTVPQVETGHGVFRLWKDGTSGPEYFLLENRQQTGYDAALPGNGLLLWHIDENQAGNTDENHYKVALLQADGNRDLELDHNRGDAGDPFPGGRPGRRRWTAARRRARSRTRTPTPASRCPRSRRPARR